MIEKNDDGSDYLWDGSGAPDPEVARLEKLLAPLGYRGAPPAIGRRRRRGRRGWIAASASIAVALSAAAWLVVARLPAKSSAPVRPVIAAGAGSPWGVTALAGMPSCSGAPVAPQGRLAVGEWLVTDGASRAHLDVADIGAVDVDPNSRLRLVETSARAHRIELARGAITARVDAPPRLFVVETPSGTAVDLGCAYRLTVDGAGATHLAVLTGKVALDRGGRESIVPAGACCDCRPGRPPGTPYFEDAPPALRTALAAFDESGGAIDPILASARQRDSLSLWHLIARSDDRARPRVLDRLEALGMRAPAGVRRDALLARDPQALERLREALEPAWTAPASPGPGPGPGKKKGG